MPNKKNMFIFITGLAFLLAIFLFLNIGVTSVEIRKYNNDKIEWDYRITDKAQCIELEQAFNDEKSYIGDNEASALDYEVKITYNFLMSSSARFALEASEYDGATVVKSGEKYHVLSDNSKNIIKDKIDKYLSEKK